MALNVLPIDDAGIAMAVLHLAAGRLVILPTDTVYGLAADARREGAVAAIPRAKGRSEAMPLQLLFSADTELVARYTRLSAGAARLVEALGPGGWTIICPAAQGFASPALAGGRTVGFRIPDAPVVHRIVERLGGPLAASSANVHGGPSPTRCEEAVEQVGRHCAVALDGGETSRGLDSTVIDCSESEVTILREGAIPREQVARILGVREIPVLRSVRR